MALTKTYMLLLAVHHWFGIQGAGGLSYEAESKGLYIALCQGHRCQ